jgi:hypothetical protein
MGIGDWGLGGPIPNPQSPIPNPHKLFYLFQKAILFLFRFKIIYWISNLKF